MESLIYLDVMERFLKSSNHRRELPVDTARKILGMYFHFSKEKISGILHELHCKGFIKMSNHAWLIIVWRPAD